MGKVASSKKDSSSVASPVKRLPRIIALHIIACTVRIHTNVADDDVITADAKIKYPVSAFEISFVQLIRVQKGGRARVCRFGHWVLCRCVHACNVG